VDWTYVNVRDKPFSEAEKAFGGLRERLHDVFAFHPFLYLHFLRAIEDRLLTLAVEKEEPLSKCLDYLRRRLDLEYDHDGIYGKAAQAVLFANYAARRGERRLAAALLEEERTQLEETRNICEGWLATIIQSIDRLKSGNMNL